MTGQSTYDSIGMRYRGRWDRFVAKELCTNIWFRRPASPRSAPAFVPFRSIPLEYCESCHERRLLKLSLSIQTSICKTCLYWSSMARIIHILLISTDRTMLTLWWRYNYPAISTYIQHH